MSTTDPILIDTIKILKKFSPRAIFVYGSRGRGDFNEQSDYEVGVVFDADNYTDRSKIHDAISDPSVKVYPFKWEDLVSGNLNIVFQKSLYLKELKLGARMLYGDDILSKIPDTPVTILDLLQRTRFDIGLALASLLSYRAKDMQTSMEEFTKSCLFGLRTLLIFEQREFPIGYEDIYDKSKSLDLEASKRSVIDAAILYRRDGTVPNIDVIYENISLLDSLIEPKLIEKFNKDGNIVIL